MKRLAALLLFGAASLARAGAPTPPNGACATAHPLATQACIDTLAAGGNAFDAAVAASAVLAVAEPTGSGFGGGGFWLLHRAAAPAESQDVFVDGREIAPEAASANMYLDARGRADAHKSRDGALAAGVPGEPAAWAHLATRYGKLPLSQLLAPAIRAAREGFAVDDKLAAAIAANLPRLSGEAPALLAPGGAPLKSGVLLRQPDLAQTLEVLARDGADGIYRGAFAQKWAEAVRAAGGIWSAGDLARYRVAERAPLVTYFRDYRVVTAPPPSAGGIALAEIFQQLELLGWRADSGAQGKHQVIEAMRRAYLDRGELGDPDFVSVPLRALTARSHAAQLAASIRKEGPTPSAELPSLLSHAHEGGQTTHLSVLDRAGNRVAATMSINLSFGSGAMVGGTGVFLNDEMDDFSAALDAANAYGLIGSKANAIAPGKRPLSSMTPTFVEGPRGLLILGTPGGSRIITMVALGVLGWTSGLDAAGIAALRRYHHQYLPDVVEYEPGAFTDAESAALTASGYHLVPAAGSTLNLIPGTYGNLQVVTWDVHAQRVEAASDPRAIGRAQVAP